MCVCERNPTLSSFFVDFVDKNKPVIKKENMTSFVCNLIIFYVPYVCYGVQEFVRGKFLNFWEVLIINMEGNS